ncbi:nucleotide sugar dehydrogenase [Shewanella sp. SNU WT4]|uniref:nucleotide sugar dehydrogenase n=1 Tax=Shewanella sp. SNU WT4 TaxID=2590015 RepID=UPI0011280A29|nr:nucleotide sugar dehydrogenase [Shewanella sp. SNU WT4]QDF66082.1 nucleotide sugar dehydrogenase [Shewanella sp. SNU WT4]
MIDVNNTKIAIIGLGYVGLPLAVEFGKKFNTVGFDINSQRVRELNDGIDLTLEITSEELKASHQLAISSNIDDISDCNVYIVTVPTPINKFKAPDLSPVINASKMIGKLIKLNDIVIYESTVYPGATEEVAVPAIEKQSGMRFNQDFFVGYSPERINPGDKSHTVTNILKVTSGSTPEIGQFVDELYKSIIVAGTHLAPSIKVAEAAKVIENTQRDINIALVNELSLIFERLDIDTNDVLDAAATKWNFIKLKPGLVGGHCIGVDPYYLAHKAESVGFHPQMILSGRRTNESMVAHIAYRLTKLMNNKKIFVLDSNVLVLGYTFKENCPDIRNSKVEELISELETHNINVDIYDPWCDVDECMKENGRQLLTELTDKKYEAIILAVPHNEFLAFSEEKIKSLQKKKSVIFDVKGVWPRHLVDTRM